MDETLAELDAVHQFIQQHDQGQCRVLQVRHIKQVIMSIALTKQEALTLVTKIKTGPWTTDESTDLCDFVTSHIAHSGRKQSAKPEHAAQKYCSFQNYCSNLVVEVCKDSKKSDYSKLGVCTDLVIGYGMGWLDSKSKKHLLSVLVSLGLGNDPSQEKTKELIDDMIKMLVAKRVDMNWQFSYITEYPEHARDLPSDVLSHALGENSLHPVMLPSLKDIESYVVQRNTHRALRGTARSSMQQPMMGSTSINPPMAMMNPMMQLLQMQQMQMMQMMANGAGSSSDTDNIANVQEMMKQQMEETQRLAAKKRGHKQLQDASHDESAGKASEPCGMHRPVKPLMPAIADSAATDYFWERDQDAGGPPAPGTPAKGDASRGPASPAPSGAPAPRGPPAPPGAPAPPDQPTGPSTMAFGPGTQAAALRQAIAAGAAPKPKKKAAGKKGAGGKGTLKRPAAAVDLDDWIPSKEDAQNYSTANSYHSKFYHGVRKTLVSRGWTDDDAREKASEVAKIAKDLWNSV